MITLELRESLYYLFSQHGRVLDIVALKTMKMRGQAFVVFDTAPAATVAMRELQGFPLYDKNMVRLEFCRSSCCIDISTGFGC